MSTTEACPICDIGQLSNADQTHTITHKGVSGEVKLHMSVCNHCECKQASPTQVNNNKQEVAAFKTKVEQGILTDVAQT